MSDELFNIPEQLSPRLKWLIYYEVSTCRDDDCVEPWSAHTTRPGAITSDPQATGLTEHDAIVALALKQGWKLWNEQ